MKHTLYVFLVSALFFQLNAQEKEYKVGSIGFYNFENLFDTLDSPEIRDEEFTPNGDKLYNTTIYQEKLDHLASVVAELGTELTPDGIAVLGVAEIENRKVLEDFSQHPKVKNRNYQVVHFDSPDRRGIDVALLYQPKYFTVTHSEAVPLLIYEENGERIFTRDILYVAGEFDGEPIHLLVNHWPSRRGGEAASAPLRNAGAAVCKKICDSLTQINPYAKVMIMGDLNDDPASSSVKKVLQAKRKKTQVADRGLYNPMYDYYKKGIGTLAYRDAWNLFDQIIMTKGFITPDAGGYQYFRTEIHNKTYLVQKEGRFKGYPYRSFAGDTYLGVYSDHFPVYVYLLIEK